MTSADLYLPYLTFQTQIGNGHVSVISGEKITLEPYRSSFKYLDSNGQLKDESQDEPKLPPPDYDKQNPVFIDDTDEPEVKYQVHTRNDDNDNDSIEVKYRGIYNDNISDEIKYHTPPYDTYGYSRHTSPRAMYSNPVYGVVRPKSKRQEEDRMGPYSAPMYDSYGYFKGASPRTMYAKEFGEFNSAYEHTEA